MPATRRAMLVGWSDYEALPRLHCSRFDAIDFAETLQKKDVGGFTDIKKFVEGEDSLTIMRSLERLLTTETAQGDLALFYFSGHGMLDSEGKLYLAVNDTKADLLDTSSLAVERVMSYVRRARSRSIVVVLDCCYSGAVRETVAKGSVGDRLAALHQSARGTHVLTSSTDYQESHEKQGERNSVFTKFLLEGITTGKADRDEDSFVTVDEAYQYAYDCVRGTGLQSPVHYKTDAEGSPVLAANPAGLLPPPELAKVSPEFRHCFIAVQQMISLIRADETVMVAVVFVPGRGYEVAGERYSASAFTLSAGHTPFIHQTDYGFVCDAFFPPDIMGNAARKDKEVINGVIKVRLSIRLEDIWMISGTAGNDSPITLYMPH